MGFTYLPEKQKKCPFLQCSHCYCFGSN